MNEPVMEPELVKAKLKEMKCPFEADDCRSSAWLLGFQEGYARASDNVIERLENLMGKI